MNEASVNVLEPLADTVRSHGLQPMAARLDALKDWLANDLADLEDELGKAGAVDDLAGRAARWLLARPGKRVRPLCVLLASRLGPVEPSREAVRHLAVAAELAHAATLLHDDVIDQGDERRGAPTARMVYGNAASVLAGDHLLVLALRRVEAVDRPALLSSLLGVIAEMVAGEAIQLERRGRFEPDPDAYDRVVNQKTASLFAWAMRAGATMAGCSMAQIEASGRFGLALGMAFQLTDDALDVAGDPAQTGKDVLLDLREGKLTWPLLVACQRQPALLAELQLVARDPGVHDLVNLRQRLLATGCIAETVQRARDQALAAQAALEPLAAGPAKSALLAVVKAVVEREG
jgi:octaprenyl-diphosphate synthase